MTRLNIELRMYRSRGAARHPLPPLDGEVEDVPGHIEELRPKMMLGPQMCTLAVVSDDTGQVVALFERTPRTSFEDDGVARWKPLNVQVEIKKQIRAMFDGLWLVPLTSPGREKFIDEILKEVHKIRREE